MEKSAVMDISDDDLIQIIDALAVTEDVATMTLVQQLQAEDNARDHLDHVMDAATANLVQQLLAEDSAHCADTDDDATMNLVQKLHAEEVARASQDHDLMLARVLQQDNVDDDCDYSTSSIAKTVQQEESLRLAVQLQFQEENYTTKKPPSRDQVWQSLAPCQMNAIRHVESSARKQHEIALASPTFHESVRRLGFKPHNLILCLEYIREDAPIVIHFKAATLSLLLKDTNYRNFFETNTSGGKASKAHRIQWEKDMFGGAYDSCDPFDRPKYGCLNLTGDICGVKAAVCYGSFCMTLVPQIRYRTTFFDRDSSSFRTEMSSLATSDWYAHILMSYNDDELRSVLGLCRIGGAASTRMSIYKEAQIHGPIQLATDVQSLSVPGHLATATADLKADVDAFQKMTGCNILWQGDLLGIRIR